MRWTFGCILRERGNENFGLHQKSRFVWSNPVSSVDLSSVVTWWGGILYPHLTEQKFPLSSFSCTPYLFFQNKLHIFCTNDWWLLCSFLARNELSYTKGGARCGCGEPFYRRERKTLGNPDLGAWHPSRSRLTSGTTQKWVIYPTLIFSSSVLWSLSCLPSTGHPSPSTPLRTPTHRYPAKAGRILTWLCPFVTKEEDKFFSFIYLFKKSYKWSWRRDQKTKHVRITRSCMYSCTTSLVFSKLKHSLLLILAHCVSRIRRQGIGKGSGRQVFNSTPQNKMIKLGLRRFESTCDENMRNFMLSRVNFRLPLSFLLCKHRAQRTRAD